MHYKWMIYLLTIMLLSVSCTDSNDMKLPSEKDAFAIQFSLPGVTVETSTRSDISLAEGVKLRILAFRRAGTDPDLSQDSYMGEAVYVMGSDGKMTSDNPLFLRSGTYDFYALTPGLEVSSVDDSEGGKSYKLEVGQGMDYANSLTEAVSVSESSSTVSLNTLTRCCVKLTFALSPKGDNITSVSISSAGLTNMTDPPLTTGLNEALDISDISQTKEISIPGSDFSTPDESKPLEVEASTIVLPRAAGDFSFKMSVEYDDSGKTLDLSAALPDDLVFSPGMHYTFTVKMRGERTDLVLTVAAWDNDNFHTDMGGAGTEILIGAWTGVEWSDGNADIGGGNTGVTPDGWSGSHTTDSTNGGDMGE